MNNLLELDFSSLKNEIETQLTKMTDIVLATSLNNSVTARRMAQVEEGINLFFMTGVNSEKIEQIKGNNQIAFAGGNIQIEAIATIKGELKNYSKYIELLVKKYPHYEHYTSIPGQILVYAETTKVKLYKFIDNTPYNDVLDAVNNKAYRIVLD